MRRYFFFACIVVTAVVAIRLCVGLFSAGDDSLTDIRQVGAEPEAYAGQTLTSCVIIIDPNHFRHTQGTRDWHLALKTTPDLDANAKVKRILQTYGQSKSVIIEYEMYDQTTLAAITAYQEAQERIRRCSQRKLTLEKERGRLDKPLRKLEAIEKLRFEAKANLQRLTEEKEQLAKDVALFRASEKDKLDRTSEIEAKLQRLTEERAQLVKERLRLLASEEVDKPQRVSEIEATLKQLTEEKKELAKEKDKLHPEIKVEAQLQRLVNEETRLQGLAKDRKGREQFNRDNARLAEAQAKSLGLAASRVEVVPPTTPYPTVSRARRTSSSVSSSSRFGGSRSSTKRRRAPTLSASQLDQQRRATAERKLYAAQKKKQNRLLAQEKRQRKRVLTAKTLVARFAKEQLGLQQAIKENAELQRATREKQRLLRMARNNQLSRHLARPKENLRELVKEEANLQRLSRQKEQLQPLTKPNAPRLAAIAEELAKIEKAEKTEKQVDFPVDFNGAPLENINYSGVLWDIRLP